MRSRAILWTVILVISAAAVARSQQHFTQTVTRQNTNCNSTCSVIDIPELNLNPAAIIYITPIGNTKNLNPHPIGAYYMYLKKWSVFNLDSTTISEGSKFDIEYYANPDTDRFVFVVPQRVHFSDPAYIDHVGLNYNPNARIRIFPTTTPGRGAVFNKFEVKVEYDPIAFKWFVANVNGTVVSADSAFNIFVSDATAITTVEPTTLPGRTAPGSPLPSGSPPIITTTTPVVPTTTIGSTPPRPQQVHDWILRPDAIPSIPANSDILLFIHGMDSRAEEADDITNALFALKASPGGPQANPPPSNAQMIADLQRILNKYKGCILEKYETKADMTVRGMSPNLSGLASTYGLQDRDGIACVAGNICTHASRQASFAALQAQANSGNANNFETMLKQAIPADCFQCSKHAEWHTKHVHCTMDAGGNNGLPAGAVFQTCQAGVDISKLINDLINDVHTALSGAGGGSRIGGPTIATNYRTVRFDDCAVPSEGCSESCDHPDDFSNGTRSAVTPFEIVNGQQVPLYFEPFVPPGLLDTSPPPGTHMNIPAGHNIGMNEGRLRLDLRNAAAAADPLQSLRIAAYKYAAGDEISGRAFADLSVTGHRSFAAFRTALPKDPFCDSIKAGRPTRISEADVLTGCHSALDRAYRVANFLRTGQRGDTPTEKTRKTNERLFLGWIAVSGEDDSPHRPVNVPSSDYPQYDVDVVVEAPGSVLPTKSVTVRTRYVIAQSQTAHPNSPGRNLVVISLDLPTSGYSENLNYSVVSPLADIGAPKWTSLPIPLVIPIAIGLPIPGFPPILPPGTIIPPGTPLPDFQSSGKTPLLDFIEKFIVRFTETLDRKQYLDKNKFKAVMGGSLGGNMTFRLGRNPDVPWLPKFIVWSPASIWQSLGEGNDILKHVGPRKAFESADAAANQPTAGDRADFFGGWDKPILPLVIPMAQSDTWTSDYYPCKKSSVAGARLDRQETYDKWFLAWHWRLGGEQLLYSHQTTDLSTGLPRYMSNQKPMLLGCGLEDHVAFNDICPATQSTARMMITTPGKALFLDKTGHSLDNERRTFWAKEILEFLK